VEEPAGTPGRVLVGRIRRPVGLRGEVLVEPTGDDPDRFAAGRRLFLEGEPTAEVVVRASRPSKKRALAVFFEGIETIEEAEALRGRRLYVRPEDLPPLPPGRYYYYQLFGLEVVDAAGVVLGRVEAILETGSNDVYCVGKGREEILIPAVPDFVAKVDLATKRILLAVPRSALGGEDPPV
jgi:16S rRNA processing protein RimM